MCFQGQERTYSQGEQTNFAYPNLYIETKTPNDSKNHIVVPDTVKMMFNLDIEATEKARSIIKGIVNLFLCES